MGNKSGSVVFAIIFILGSTMALTSSLFLGTKASYGDKPQFTVYFSHRDVKDAFDEQEWLDATVISYPSTKDGNNTIFVKYLETANQLLVLFRVPDRDIGTHDLVHVGLDMDRDGDQLPDVNDYILSIEASTGRKELFRGDANGDWVAYDYPGLTLESKVSGENWIAFWRIPINISDGSLVGFMFGQLISGRLNDFPGGANDLAPNTWGTIRLTKLLLTISPEQITYGETATIEIQANKRTTIRSITLQYARKSGSSAVWENVTSGSLSNGFFSTKWSPPNSGVLTLRTLWDRRFDGEIAESTHVPLVVNKAEARLDLDVDPLNAYADDSITVKVRTNGVYPLNGDVAFEFKADKVKEWIPLHTGKLGDSLIEYNWSSIKAPGNYTMRALWEGDENHLPTNATRIFLVTSELREVSKLKDLLKKSSQELQEFTAMLNRTRGDLKFLAEANVALNRNASSLGEKIAGLGSQLDLVENEREMYFLVAVAGWIATVIASISLTILHIRRRNK